MRNKRERQQIALDAVGWTRWVHGNVLTSMPRKSKQTWLLGFSNASTTKQAQLDPSHMGANQSERNRLVSKMATSWLRALSYNSQYCIPITTSCTPPIASNFFYPSKKCGNSSTNLQSAQSHGVIDFFLWLQNFLNALFIGASIGETLKECPLQS